MLWKGIEAKFWVELCGRLLTVLFFSEILRNGVHMVMDSHAVLDSYKLMEHRKYFLDILMSCRAYKSSKRSR